jgi:hypothetical protein
MHPEVIQLSHRISLATDVSARASNSELRTSRFGIARRTHSAVNTLHSLRGAQRIASLLFE